ncbi:MAG: hypothetical protein KJZ83_00440 [Burkholderiaceae bacterium]|nr:hypothetical protein [Burkholderiaceae bacterium]
MGSKIYRFSAGHCDWTETDQKLAKKHLGGKGAALVMMAQAGMPVPPGFTIPTDLCLAYMQLEGKERDEFIKDVVGDAFAGMQWLTKQFGYTPLVSVRSGAPVSMPGMMDTILNVGLTEDNFGAWADRIGQRAAMDSQRRLIQMLGSTAYGVPHAVFEFQLAKLKKELGKVDDTELDFIDLSSLVARYRKAFKENKGFPFPDNDAQEQLRAAIRAVFDSWMNPRAIEYRKLNKIDEGMGTAVNVQAMVFGNMGDDSGTGVLFTRDPSTGNDSIMGEFLQNAQGEDVVAGIRTPRPLKEMQSLGGEWPKMADEIIQTCHKLEDMYKDMVDVEFTVQQGQLFILQSRVGKRSARAAFKIAIDLVWGDVIDRETALKRLTKAQFKAVRRPMLDPSFKADPKVVGLPASPGVVTGKPVFSSGDAINCMEPCILVTHETTPDDIAGMNAAIGILTQTGGATSHAAVVARAMDKTCVVGCTALDMEAAKKCKKVTIDGNTGNVWFEIDVPVIDSSGSPEVKKVVGWCLDKMQAYESSPVDLGADHRRHAVQAAYWWGSEEVLGTVLNGLAALPSLEHVILDIRSPLSLCRDADLDLIDAFGTEPDNFVSVLLDRASQMPELKGLKVVHETGSSEDPVIVPADYAAFSVLTD